MRRALVVEAVAVARKSDGVQPARQFGKATRLVVGLWRLPGGIISRQSRVLRKGVQDVGEDQFLVLLLVVEADLEDAQHLRKAFLVGTRDQPLDRRVDMRAIRGDLGAVRPRDEPALRPAWRGPAAT